MELKISREDKEKFDRLFSKAMVIYNKIIWLEKEDGTEDETEDLREEEVVMPYRITTMNFNVKALAQLSKEELSKLTKEELANLIKMETKHHNSYNEILNRYRNKITPIRLNEDGKIIGHPTIISPYRAKPIPAEKIQALNEAIGLFKEASKVGPHKGSPHKWIGRIYDFLTLYDEAIECYKKAIELQPQYKEELLSRIEECKQQQKRKKAYLDSKDVIYSSD